MTHEDHSGIHIWLVLMKAYQALQKHAEISLKGMEHCFSDFVILEALLHKGPMPINCIGDKFLLTSGSLTAAVDRLEKKGLVERRFHESDRRSRIVHLTEAGTAEIEALFERHETYFEEMISGSLTLEERQTLTQLLKKLGKAAASRLGG